MKALIIGGTGVIGGAIAETAIRAGHEVTVICRRQPGKKWKSVPATYIRGDWYDDRFAEMAVQNGYDIIVDTLIFDEKQMKRSAGIVNSHCKQFIYISTDSVYPHPGENVSEDGRIDLSEIKWDYGTGKRKAELYLQEHSSEYDFEWTVIRPAITFGDTRIPAGFSSRRGTYTLIDRIENRRPVIRFDNGSALHSFCHDSIFGNAVSRLFLNEDAYGKFFHISDDAYYSFDDIFAVLESIAGQKGIYAFMEPEAVRKYSKSIYEDMIYDKEPAFTLDNSKIKDLCPDVSFHVDLRDVLDRTAGFLREQREEAGADKDYDMLTDLLLVENRDKLEGTDSYADVCTYLDGLSGKYISDVGRYGKSIIKSGIIGRIKRTLGPIKHKFFK